MCVRVVLNQFKNRTWDIHLHWFYEPSLVKFLLCSSGNSWSEKTREPFREVIYNYQKFILELKNFVIFNLETLEKQPMNFTKQVIVFRSANFLRYFSFLMLSSFEETGILTAG